MYNECDKYTSALDTSAQVLLIPSPRHRRPITPTIPCVILPIDDITLPSQHHMLDIDLRALEPLMCAHKPPNRHKNHGSAIHKRSPVHSFEGKVGASHGWEAENWNHECNEAGRDDADRNREFPEVPGAGAEAVTDEEDTDEDWECKSWIIH